MFEAFYHPEPHDIPDDSKALQRLRMLRALQDLGELSTTDFRDYMGICHPGGRVHDLRQQGYTISTRMVLRADAEGRLHKQAVYRLEGRNHA